MKAIQVFKFILSLALCFGASGLGVIFVNADSIANWYNQLQKPSFTPPNWVFGPVWTVLYLLMGISFFLVWNKGIKYPKVKLAIVLFLIQLILNAIWTPIFFGFHLILLALIDIILLFIAILITLIVFKKISFSASMLLLPYLIWVGCATMLNGSICYLNQDKCFMFSSQENDNRVIMTVNGIIKAESFGKALVHEHIICDFIGADKVQKSRYDSNEVVSKMLPYLQDIQKQGFTGFVDCTPVYIGRDVQILHRLSELSGLHILTNTGYYGAAGDKYLPSHAFSETADELASRWIKEWKNGIEGTKIKPGFIKIGVDADTLSDVDQKLVKAASRTHIKTGMPIACHTGEGTSALEVLNIIISEGVDPSALIIVHADSIADVNTHFEIASIGAWIEYDGIGNRPIEYHIKLIKQMINAGYSKRLLLSHDAGWYWVGEPDGGKIRSFRAIDNDLIPKLKSEGLDDNILKELLVDNPANAFTIKDSL